MNKIFVPFDFSAYAENALAYAVGLAQRIEASITLFHVFELPVPAGYEDASLTYNMALATKEKQALQDRIAGSLEIFQESFYVGTSTPVAFQVEIRQADLEDGVVGYLKHQRHNLVVMGTKGVQGWEEMLGDSNTTLLSSLIDTSLVVVPLQARFDGLGHIVYASNFDKQDALALQAVVEFNGFFEGRVTCLHVNRLDGDKGMRSAEKMAQLAQLAQDAGLQGVHFEVVEADTVEQGLFAFAHEANADLLVVRPQDHGVLGSIFHKSVSKQLSNHTNLPLLIMK